MKLSILSHRADGASAPLSYIPVLLKGFAPLPSTLSLALPRDSKVSTVISALERSLDLSGVDAGRIRLTRLGGQTISSKVTFAKLAGPPRCNGYGRLVISPVTLEVRMGIRGGKGGFGSMLRAQGGKMSSNRNGEENNDSCRDLNGRRLSTVKQARQLALYLSSQAEREKELSEAQKKKYAKLEKMLGRKPKGESDFVEAAQKLDDLGGSLEDAGEENAESDDLEREPSSSSSSDTKRVVERRKLSGNTDDEARDKKRNRIDDTEYIEQSREIVDNVRNAVASAMMKKKKKGKQRLAKNNNGSSKASLAPPPQAV